LAVVNWSHKHALLADIGFSRISAAWKSNSNDSNLVGGSANRLTAVDPYA